MIRQLVTLSILVPLSSCRSLARESSSLADKSRAISTIQSVKLQYASLGKGRTLLFIHGFGANSYTWSKISPTLSQHYRLILLDLKGHGQSPKPDDGQYSLRDQAELVSAFISDNQLKKVTLIGHSLGGGISLLVALKFASQNPNVIASLILIDSVAYSQDLPTFIRLLRIPVLAQLVVSLVPNRLQALQVLKLAYYDNKKITNETIDAYSGALALPGAHRAMIETAKQIIPQDIEEIGRRYRTIRIPTLLIWGKEDRIVPLEVAERLHRSMPNSSLIVMDGVGHVPQEEAPMATLEAMQTFFKAKD